jgi:hypothetical protein
VQPGAHRASHKWVRSQIAHSCDAGRTHRLLASITSAAHRHNPIADHNTTIDHQILIEVNMTNVDTTPVAQAFADGSIMPRVTTGNTMAPCVIIGERATDILAAQQTL